MGPVGGEKYPGVSANAPVCEDRIAIHIKVRKAHLRHEARSERDIPTRQAYRFH